MRKTAYILCPVCLTTGRSAGQGNTPDGACVVRYYHCDTCKKKFMTYETVLAAVDHDKVKAYRANIKSRTDADRRRRYVAAHPELSEKMIASRLRIAVLTVRHIRQQIVRGPMQSRLSPPREID